MRCPSCNHINAEKAPVCTQCYATLVARKVSAPTPFATSQPNTGEVSLDDLLQNARVGGTKIAAPNGSANTAEKETSVATANELKSSVPADMQSMRVDSLLQTNLLDNILNPNQPKVEQLTQEERSVVAYHNRYGRINELPEPPKTRLGSHGNLFYIVDEAGDETVYAFPSNVRRFFGWAVDNLIMLTLSLVGYLSLKLTLLSDMKDSAFDIIQNYILSQFSPEPGNSYSTAGREQLERTIGQFNTVNAPALAIMLIFVIIPFLYSFLSLGISGKTFGYFLLDMRAVKFADGGHIGVVGAFVRTIYFSLPQLACVVGLIFYPTFLTAVLVLITNLLIYAGQAAAVFNQQKRGLHDLIAGTCVINHKPEPRLPNHIYDTLF